jgi:hypothetical protein
MTETEWLTSSDPTPMLEALTIGLGDVFPDPNFRPSDRKLRLLEDACFERFGLNLDDVTVQAVPPSGVCDLIRCVHGNPWRPVLLSSLPWRIRDAAHHVHQIARTIYQERDFSSLGILADALEEAGCPAEVDCRCQGDPQSICYACDGSGRVPNPLLAHLRSPGPHALPGCHVVDLTLGKE